MVTKRATWGTVAQGKDHERERGYKNRIHDLETELAGAQVVIGNLTRAKHQLERQLDALASTRFLAAVENVCDIPFAMVVALDLVDDLRVLAEWREQLDGKVATGNSEES